MAVQDVVLPKEHCDDRVEILQADARELDVRQLFTKSEVRCLPKRMCTHCIICCVLAADHFSSNELLYNLKHDAWVVVAVYLCALMSCGSNQQF